MVGGQTGEEPVAVGRDLRLRFHRSARHVVLAGSVGKAELAQVAQRPVRCLFQAGDFRYDAPRVSLADRALVVQLVHLPGDGIKVPGPAADDLQHADVHGVDLTEQAHEADLVVYDRADIVERVRECPA